MKNVCIIPARGGSKRIPRKNIIDFFDRPMIAWTIAAAVESGLFDKVVVSTDSDEIAQVAIAHGAEVPMLRQAKHDDISPVSEATIHTLAQLDDQLGWRFETVTQLMANCPLRDAKDIRSAHENFLNRQLDFQLSSFKFGWMNPWWAVKISDDQKPQPMFPEGLKTRSQDLPPLYCPTGAIWMANVDALKKSNTFYGPGYEFFEVDWISAVDIDDESDLLMARAAFLVRTGA